MSTPECGAPLMPHLPQRCNLCPSRPRYPKTIEGLREHTNRVVHHYNLLELCGAARSTRQPYFTAAWRQAAFFNH